MTPPGPPRTPSWPRNQQQPTGAILSATPNPESSLLQTPAQSCLFPVDRTSSRSPGPGGRLSGWVAGEARAHQHPESEEAKEALVPDIWLPDLRVPQTRRPSSTPPSPAHLLLRAQRAQNPELQSSAIPEAPQGQKCPRSEGPSVSLSPSWGSSRCSGVPLARASDSAESGNLHCFTCHLLIRICWQRKHPL